MHQYDFQRKGEESLQIGTELSEGSDLTILGKVELERTGDLLHEFGLGSRSNTRHGD